MASEPVVWFEEGRIVSKSPEEVVRDHKTFKKRLGRFLRQENRDVQIASTKEELLKHIRDAGEGHSPSLGDLAAKHFEVASKSQDVYKQQRESGIRGAGAMFQRVLYAFAQFAASYSSILDAVSSAAGPYGQVGYQTLSILLLVIVNKTNNDKGLLEHLEQIRKSMPRLQKWTGIYPSDEMRELVANAYHVVIQFSRAAAEYFCRYWKRFWLAANPLAKIDFDEIAQSIYKILAEINAAANYGLHERSQNIEETVVNLKLMIEDLKAKESFANKDRQKLLAQNEHLKQRLEEQRRREEERDRQADERRFHDFENLLGAQLPHRGTDTESAKKNLTIAFPNTERFSSGEPYTAYKQMNEAMLFGLEEFQAWTECTSSCLLFLSGRTAFHGSKLHGASPCWLSPAAIYITEHLRKQDKKVAFFSCRPDWWESGAAAVSVLSVITLQILQWRPQLLRDKYDDFQRVVGAVSDPTSISRLVDLLIAILAEMRSEGTIFVVIDRLDSCDVGIKAVMNELARLVTKLKELEDGSCQVKLFVIVEASMNGDWQVSHLPGDYAVERLYSPQNLNQKRLTTQESAMRHWPPIWSSTSTITG